MATVLLVEDDPDYRNRYESSLKASGFTVITAEDGTEIEPVISHTPIDIIVSDTELLTLEGDKACRRLFEQGRLNNVLIIAMSDAIDNEQYWKGVAHDFLYKSGITNLGSAVRTRYQEFISSQSSSN